jgi:hypothetical protein
MLTPKPRPAPVMSQTFFSVMACSSFGSRATIRSKRCPANLTPRGDRRISPDNRPAGAGYQGDWPSPLRGSQGAPAPQGTRSGAAKPGGPGRSRGASQTWAAKSFPLFLFDSKCFQRPGGPASGTTQAQRPGARDAPIATATLTPGSLQRLVRCYHFHTPVS